MKDNAHPTKIMLKAFQYVELGERLKQVCSKDQNGFARYAPGYNDTRVAAELGKPFRPSHVSGLRHQMFGGLRRPAGASDFSTKLRLTYLENIVEQLVVWGGQRTMKPFHFLPPEDTQQEV